MKHLIHLFFLVVLVSAQSCHPGSKSELDAGSLKTFSINYSFSQVSNYSYYITVNKSDSIRFEEKNFFWDRWEHKGDQLPRIKICALGKDELKELKTRVLKANVFLLKDTYGIFDGNETNKYSVLHNFSININDSIKYITLRDAKENEPSPEFLNMLKYLIELRQKYDTEYGKKIK